MNKVINGKRYDTDKAEQIAQSDNGCYVGDLDYYCETLYRCLLYTSRERRKKRHGEAKYEALMRDNEIQGAQATCGFWSQARKVER